ncbi:hypothetical protein ACJX0J_022530 [Zea mays]
MKYHGDTTQAQFNLSNSLSKNVIAMCFIHLYIMKNKNKNWKRYSIFYLFITKGKIQKIINIIIKYPGFYFSHDGRVGMRLSAGDLGASRYMLSAFFQKAVLFIVNKYSGIVLAQRAAEEAYREETMANKNNSTKASLDFIVSPIFIIHVLMILTHSYDQIGAPLLFMRIENCILSRAHGQLEA